MRVALEQTGVDDPHKLVRYVFKLLVKAVDERRGRRLVMARQFPTSPRAKEAT